MKLAGIDLRSIYLGATQVVKRLSDFSCLELNTNLTNAQRQLIHRVNSIKTGQITSYRTGDDGNLSMGRLPSVSSLDCNNGFGNTNRFTDVFGGQVYASNLVIDWATGLMWRRIPFTATNWNDAIDAAIISTEGGFSGWRMPNIKTLFDLVNWEIQPGLDTSPFNLSGATTGDRLWTSTTQKGITTNAYIYDPSSSRTINLGVTKGTSHMYLICRTFNFSNGVIS
jgi:hypothetical protein